MKRWQKVAESDDVVLPTPFFISAIAWHAQARPRLELKQNLSGTTLDLNAAFCGHISTYMAISSII